MTSQIEVELQFMSALAVVLVSGAALISVITARCRTGGRASRAVLGAGLAAVAGAAVSRGAFVTLDTARLEIIGLVIVAVAGWRVRRSPPGRLVLLAAACGIGAAAARLSGGTVVADELDVVTAILGTFALAGLASRSLSTQITAVAGGVAVGAVAALAALVSVGVGGDLRGAAVRQLATRLDFEAALVDRLAPDALTAARMVAEGQAFAAQSARLPAIQARPGPDPSINDALMKSSADSSADGVLYLAGRGAVVGQTGFGGPVPTAVATTAATFVDGLTRGRTGVRRAGDQVVALGAVPVAVGGRIVGDVVAVNLVGQHLARRSADGVILEAVPVGSSLPPADPLARAAVAGHRTVTSTRIVGTVLAARALSDGSDAGATPVAVLVARTPAGSVAGTERALLRWLLLLAVAAALVVTGVCVALATRIGGRLALLTGAAQRLRRGDLATRAGVPGDDEVARLGDAFDEMAASLQRNRDDLLGAVVRETGLRDRLMSVVGGIQEAVIAIERDGRITELNRSAEMLLNLGSESAVGRPLDDVVSARPAQITDAVLETASTGLTGVPRWRAALDPFDVPVEVSATPLGDPGDPQGAVILLRDLRPELEAQRLKNEVLQRVSHELRTPLTPIKAWALLLGRRDLRAEEAAEIGLALVTSSSRLEHSVDQLIFMATSYDGELAIESVPADELVVDATRAWQASTPTHRRVRVRCRRGLPIVRADRRWIEQAFRELLDNAVKFSPDGSDIAVNARPGPGADEISLSVTDSGEGLGDDLGRLMSAFEQGDGSSTRTHEGLGLGLAIVDRVVRAHHGRLEATRHRRGVTLSLVMPAEATERTSKRTSERISRGT